MSVNTFSENIFSALTLEAGDNWVNRHGLHVVFSVVVKILHVEAWNWYFKMETQRLSLCVCMNICLRVCVFVSMR